MRATSKQAVQPGELEAARWLFANSLDLFVVLDGESIVRINPAWTSVTGWQEADVVGRPFLSFTHPEDLPTIEAGMAAVRAQGDGDGIHRLLAKSGTWLWVSTRAKVASNGNLMVVAQDITERHAREAEADVARRAGALLREAAGVRTWRYDPDRNVYDFNPNFSRPMRVGDDSLAEAREIQAAVHPDDGGRVFGAWRRTAQTGDIAIVDYRSRRADGSWSHVRSAWRGVRPAPSGQWHVIGITQDLTELTEARDAALAGEQAATAAAEAKSEFLANMSHELRTPLNGIMGALHLLKAEALSASRVAVLEGALGSGAMLAKMLSDLVDTATLRRGDLELRPERTDICALTDSVLDLFRAEAEAKGLWLLSDADPGLCWMSADPARLRQILFNLVGNAIKFTSTGGVEVRLASTGAPDHRWLRAEVRDTGIGIAASLAPHLFDRFHQGDGSSTRRFGGAGLGLALTADLVRLMGGRIGVTSQEGAGALFWFEVPLLAPAAPIADLDESPALEGLRVLVVEDNPVNQRVATLMLESLGARVTTAADGALGVQAAGQNTFDLVLMDIQMPVMDGIEACLAIRASAGPTAAAPIVAMTANVLPEQIETYSKAGMAGVVAKPFSPATLVSEVVRVCGARAEMTPT